MINTDIIFNSFIFCNHILNLIFNDLLLINLDVVLKLLHVPETSDLVIIHYHL